MDEARIRYEIEIAVDDGSQPEEWFSQHDSDWDYLPDRHHNWHAEIERLLEAFKASDLVVDTSDKTRILGNWRLFETLNFPAKQLTDGEIVERTITLTFLPMVEHEDYRRIEYVRGH